MDTFQTPVSLPEFLDWVSRHLFPQWPRVAASRSQGCRSYSHMHFPFLPDSSSPFIWTLGRQVTRIWSCPPLPLLDNRTSPFSSLGVSSRRSCLTFWGDQLCYLVCCVEQWHLPFCSHMPVSCQVGPWMDLVRSGSQSGFWSRVSHQAAGNSK